jgi:uncharacterized membrane protein
MKMTAIYIVLLAVSAAALWFAGSGARMSDARILVSLPHFIPAAVVSFPLGTVGLALWLCDPLNSGYAVIALFAFLVGPLIQIQLWNRLFRTRRQCV